MHDCDIAILYEFGFNDGCIQFRCAISMALTLCMLAHWCGLLGYLFGAEPSTILIKPGLFLVCQVKSSFLFKCLYLANRKCRSFSSVPQQVGMVVKSCQELSRLLQLKHSSYIIYCSLEAE